MLQKDQPDWSRQTLASGWSRRKEGSDWMLRSISITFVLRFSITQQNKQTKKTHPNNKMSYTLNLPCISYTPKDTFVRRICGKCGNLRCNNTYYIHPSERPFDVSCYILSTPWAIQKKKVVKKTVIKTKEAKITITKSESKHECSVCMENTKDHAFECGHGVCGECAKQIGKATTRKGKKGFECPECRTTSQKCIKLYF